MKLLMIDKDGTLVQPKSGAKFVGEPWDQEALPGAREAIAQYNSEGWTICIVSNQGGIEGGHKSLESTVLEMRFCLELFPEIDSAFFCPDFDGSNCWQIFRADNRQYSQANKPDLSGLFRKPKPGMLFLAISFYTPDSISIDSILIDDSIVDVPKGDIICVPPTFLYVGDMTIANSPKGEDENAAAAASVPFMDAATFRRGNFPSTPT